MIITSSFNNTDLFLITLPALQHVSTFHYKLRTTFLYGLSACHSVIFIVLSKIFDLRKVDHEFVLPYDNASG